MSENAKAKYVDLNGNGYAEKPEYMTQLNSNVLVPKTHPRIMFRGKMDSLLAKTMEAQIVAVEEGHPEVARDLEDVARLVSAALMGEVTEAPLEPFNVLGMDEAELRRVSHNPRKYIGVDHMLPDYTMGKAFCAVNALRAQTREAELIATGVFTAEDGAVQRVDLLQAMNRLSSAVYIIMCRLLAAKRQREA